MVDALTHRHRSIRLLSFGRANEPGESEMGQRPRILTQIAGVRGFKVIGHRWEDADGHVVVPIRGCDVPPSAHLVLTLQRRWTGRCGSCFAIGGKQHEQLGLRRWRDLPFGTHPMTLEYAPSRLNCKRCGTKSVEALSWADPYQRQTRRLQQQVALDAFSMPLIHVATKYAMDWHSVQRAEIGAIARWEATRTTPPLTHVGIDEKWLGRRHQRDQKFVTIVSDLLTGEPVWIGYGRDEATVAKWLATLSDEQKAAMKLAACDMHRAFKNAIRNDPKLAHVPVVHDPFHIMKRAGEALSELRRAVFFRGTEKMRAIGRGTRWLVLRAWERSTDDQRAKLRELFALNAKLARAYQVVEELRVALRAPDRASISIALSHVLTRTEKRANVPMRKLHESLRSHLEEIIALGEHRPPTGRIEALNNNWEALVRRARGYRNHEYLFRKLRFITANPVRTQDGTRRFLALGIPVPYALAA